MRTRRGLLVALVFTIASFTPVSELPGQERCPRSAEKVPRIGLLGYGVDANLVEAFRQGMRELGRIEGRDFAVEYRTAEGRVDELPARAAELVRLKVAVILASGTPSARAAQRATSTVPVVMVGIGLDPVKLGLVQSLGRPGGNITGVAALGVELVAKRLQLTRELVPKLSRVCVLLNPSNPANLLSLAELRAAASAAGVTLQPIVEAKDANELARGLATIAGAPPDGIYIIWDAMLQAHAKDIADFAMEHRIATSSAIKEFVQAGVLMSYGAKLPDQWRRTAYFVDKILRGAKPADIPVEQPTEFELVINRKTAKALGLTVPPEVLVQADKVIE